MTLNILGTKEFMLQPSEPLTYKKCVQLFDQIVEFSDKGKHWYRRSNAAIERVPMTSDEFRQLQEKLEPIKESSDETL